MTSLLRRKRRTIAHAWSYPARTSFSFVVLLCGVMLGPVQAQEWQPVSKKPSSRTVLPPPPPLSDPALPSMESQLSSDSVRPVAYQFPPAVRGDFIADPDRRRYEIELKPPGPEELFGSLESEAEFFQRIKERGKDKGEKLEFPENVVLSKTPYAGRAWPSQYFYAEPNYVCHKRLLFEEMNSERYGWELGIFQPLVSTGYFVKDFLLLPYHLGTDPCRWWDCSAGKCLPGDPVPYRCYPHGLSATGAALELAVIGTLLVIFP